MIDLSIHIEINGMQHLAGHIRGNDISDACFQYDQSYLNIPKILPISISLPLKEDAFTPVETKNYFEGLLPEGFSRKAVANCIKADEHDYISILKYFLCPDKNFDNVALDIPAIVLSFETLRFLSSIKFVILILIACDKSNLKTPLFLVFPI